MLRRLPQCNRLQPLYDEVSEVRQRRLVTNRVTNSSTPQCLHETDNIANARHRSRPHRDVRVRRELLLHHVRRVRLRELVGTEARRDGQLPTRTMGHN
jgi:hypothetical protein